MYAQKQKKKATHVLVRPGGPLVRP
jgi:hypothetical protein